MDLLRFGFPLDFNRLSPLQWEGQNHKSAIEHPRDIEAYLAEEKSLMPLWDHSKIIHAPMVIYLHLCQEGTQILVAGV